MTNMNDFDQAYTERDNLGHLVVNGRSISAIAGSSDQMTPAEREKVIQKGREFAAKPAGSDPWLLIAGKLEATSDETLLAEHQVKQSCVRVFGYPKLEGSDHTIAQEHTINVLLDSTGGMLDSAFKIVLYLSQYAKELNVYVPRRAKSASTLITLGADHVYLSPFGELGPLDTQILDPRNPAQNISALDCYQSVEYVRQFGFGTMSAVLKLLVQRAGGQIPLGQLLGTAAQFALGSITPMLQGVNALDFGAWGRSLKIGERYAQIILQETNPRASRIASDLVYGYTHHPFPIGYVEARRLGLRVEIMDQEMYEGAIAVVNECDDKAFIGFISQAESEIEEKKAAEESEQKAAAEREGMGREAPRPDGKQPSERLSGPPKEAARGEVGNPD